MIQRWNEKLNIIVCVKQVPSAESGVEINIETGTIKREGVTAETNYFDLFAIEAAVRIKEKFGGKIIAMSMGPPQAESTLRNALAMGCDEAILLSSKEF